MKGSIEVSKTIKHHLSLLGFLVILAGLAFFSLSKVQFSASLYELLPADLPEVRGMDWLNRYFSRDGQLMVTVSSPDSALSEKVARDLAEKLRSSTELISNVHQDLSLDQIAREGGSLLAWLWFNADPEEVKVLAERLGEPNSEATVAEAMGMIEEGLFDEGTIVRSYDPLALSRLPESLRSMDASKADAMASPDGKFRLFYVEGNGVNFSDYRAADVWLDQIKALVQQWRSGAEVPESVSIGLTGTPAFMAEVGTEMERDMTLSVMATMALISLLFWVMHRQSQPLGWLIASLCLILILTLNLGGLFFGKLSVMSAGFAAILLGLAVDYGIVLYREAMTGVGSPAELRRKVGPAIAWAAVTTAAVFLSLNLSSLPGIAEMGNLVAIGIGIGATVMLWGFSKIAVQFAGQSVQKPALESQKGGPSVKWPGILAGLIPLLALGSVAIKEFPHLEAEFHPFRIRSSPSMRAWQEMQSSLRGRENSVPVVFAADNMEQLRATMDSLEARLIEAEQSGAIEHFILPRGILPAPENQRLNIESLRSVVAGNDRILREIDAAGFSEEGADLTRDVLHTWRKLIDAIDNGAPFAMPEGTFAEWTVGRLFYKGDGKFAALGSARPAKPGDRDWVVAVCDERSAVASLGSLGTALNERIRGDLKYVFLPMIGILALMLAVVFRSWRDWFLAMFCLMFSSCAMVILTLWTPLSWNSFNICGLPLLFGTGLDFGIHMIFALRRSDGDIELVKRGIAKALIFCGTSSAIGFGSLSFASAHGLSSLGQICAAGILINMVVAVWLLPRWYRLLHKKGGPDGPPLSVR